MDIDTHTTSIYLVIYYARAGVGGYMTTGGIYKGPGYVGEG